ncbi:ADP-specific phosphofructokinase/Glucokinase conserved region domain-containing protein [Phthorimaea operculella]|nr:ADP-specific phosphofructokinase/Glucokinase conserved region domain-containing protein [Phthorimaea operculella]
MAGAPVKLGSILSFCIVLYAVYYRSNGVEDERLAPVKEHLLLLERENRVGEGPLQPRVALGYGACHDLFVNATALLPADQLRGAPQHFNEISSKQEFLKSFAYFFKHGAAAERFVSNGELFDDLTEQALKLPDSRWSLGGNAPLMARRLHMEGWKVLLAAKMSTKLKSYIPEGITVVGNDDNEEIKDDIHMILEYKADEKFGAFKAPRANRFIVHNDENNPLLSSLEKFGEKIPQFSPNLLVISGLQMMDNYPFKKNGKDLRAERLDLVKEQILSQPLNTLAHFEMASYVDLDLLLHLTTKVLPYVDSVGMNEQELSNLYSVLEHGQVSVVADSNPRIAASLDQMRKTFHLIRNKNKEHESRRTLTRIHVHTLAYQAILTVKNSKWTRTEAATAKASLTAHRYVCNSQNIALDKSKLLLDDSFATSIDNDNTSRVFFEPTKPVSCWEEVLLGDVVEICVAPVLICTEAQLTAGAGDNISAAGLVLQIEK